MNGYIPEKSRTDVARVARRSVNWAVWEDTNVPTQERDGIDLKSDARNFVICDTFFMASGDTLERIESRRNAVCAARHFVDYTVWPCTAADTLLRTTETV